MSRRDDDFRLGYSAAMHDNAKADLELYLMPEAKAHPFAAWAMLPHGFGREAFREALRIAPPSTISPAEAARAYEHNLAILHRKVAVTQLATLEEPKHVH